MMVASPPGPLPLTARRGTHLRALFTDEKIFTVEANTNGQNNRIIAVDIQSAYQKEALKITLKKAWDDLDVNTCVPSLTRTQRERL
uniref:Uncharacterized protein n=1 Tax=Caenorhabditis japonica TaxID=281687 RepID=A0A8R1ILH1_CAEJA